VKRSEYPPDSVRPLHVLTITPFYPRAGNESGGCFVSEPLGELLKAGAQSTVFAAEPFYRPKSIGVASAPDAEWVRYPSLPGGVGLASSGAGLFVRMRSQVERLHARSPIDLIHAHGALPCGHAALLLSRNLKVPFVVTVHGLDVFSSRQVSGWPGAWCMRASRRVYAGARRVIGVSQHVCDEVRAGMGELSATRVVYNGVDPSVFAPGGDPERPVLLTVGNLIPTKGHELIASALAGLLSEFPALIWEVIGEGTETSRVRLLAEKLGVLKSIRFRGRQSRAVVAEACRKCTVFVLPSRYEGLGCVYLEAMACGKVAIGCEGQGIEEVIRQGENGWLIPPNGLTELTEGLRVLLRDSARRTQIGAAARQTILESYTLAHQARLLLETFQETVA
jgi:teichuronic acid biosynthesis glycosyltransferase TuaC